MNQIMATSTVYFIKLGCRSAVVAVFLRHYFLVFCSTNESNRIKSNQIESSQVSSLRFRPPFAAPPEATEMFDGETLFSLPCRITIMSDKTDPLRSK